MHYENMSRRDFLAMAGASAAAFGEPQWARAARTTDDFRSADLVVYNAKIYTVDSRLPRAEAFAVRGDRFLSVGSSEEIRRLIGKKTATLDAARMTIVPGFIDSHNHAPGNELLYEVLVGNPYEVEFVTIADIIGKLRAKAQNTPPDTWVEGYFFDDTKVTDKRPLTVHDLDEVSKDLPVAVYHRGGHTTFYNSKAFAMAGITPRHPRHGERHLRPGHTRRSQRPRDR